MPRAPCACGGSERQRIEQRRPLRQRSAQEGARLNLRQHPGGCLLSTQLPHKHRQLAIAGAAVGAQRVVAKLACRVVVIVGRRLLRVVGLLRRLGQVVCDEVPEGAHHPLQQRHERLGERCMVCGSACAQRARVFTQRHAERHDELEDVCAARLPNLVVALLTRERLHCLLARQVRPRAPLLEISPEDLAQPLRRRRTRLGGLRQAEGCLARRDEQKQQLEQHVKDAHRLHHQRVERVGGLVRRRCGDEGRGGRVGGRCLDSQQCLLGCLRRHARDFGRGRDAVILPYHPA